MNRIIESSELLINEDGTIFHLHLLPENISDKIIVVGDPGRVDFISSYFDKIECRISNREFMTVTGSYKGKRLTVLSTGIGCGNIDIVVNELDALVNVDLKTRTENKDRKSLKILRIGTSGALQTDIELGSAILSEYSIGLDGIANFYEGKDMVTDIELTEAFIKQLNIPDHWAKPYAVRSSNIINDAFGDFTVGGITITSPGFYAPQGRYLRIAPIYKGFNKLMEQFSYSGLKITNYEMESATLSFLCRMLGHDSSTVAIAIAQRSKGESNVNYSLFMKKLVEDSLERFASL